MAQPSGLTPASQPALPPPPGQTSDFDAHSALYSWVLAVLVCQLVLVLFVVLVRLFTRWRTQRSLVTEDYFIIIAVLFQIGYSAAIFCSKARAWSEHMWNVRIEDYLDGLKHLYAIDTLYVVLVLFVKLAILRRFLRIFAPDRKHNQHMWIGCWVLIILDALFYIIVIGSTLDVCVPTEKFWNPSIPGRCLSIGGLYKANAVINAISDFAILILPLPTILRLRMPIEKRLYIAGIFGIGVFAVVASVMRIYYVWLTFGPNSNATWYLMILTICSSIETGMGILAFCLPTIPHFIQIVREKIRKICLGGEERVDSLPIPSGDLGINGSMDKDRGVAPFVEVSLASFERKSSRSHDLDPGSN